MNYRKLFFLAALVCIGAAASAQRPRGNKPPTVAVFKVPKLSTTLAGLKDSVAVPAKDAAAALAMPLKISDAKGNAYTITSYQFAYRQMVVTEDESLNGKAVRTTALKSSLFTSSPLPPLWVNLVGEKMVPGEELFFFAVTVKDVQGHVMYAPDLKLTVK